MDGWTAVVAAVGQHALLGVCRNGDRPTWHRLTEDTEMDLFRVALGVELLGERALVSVIAHTQANQIKGPMILRARLMARRTSPVVTRQPYGQPFAQPRRMALSPVAAVTAIVPHAKPGAPAEGASLPSPVVQGLRARVAGRQVAKVDVAIGLAVEEQWRLPSAEMIQVRYEVPAGQTTGFVTDAATSEQIHEAAACRRKHLARWLQLCSTCLTATCAACPDAVRPCTLCGGRLCGSCVAGPDGRCPACHSLRKVGLLERGKFGVSLRGAAWHSVGKHVQVTVRRDKGRWTLERWDKDGRLVVALAGEQLLAVTRMLGESA
jgi:hypothetical protein